MGNIVFKDVTMFYKNNKKKPAVNNVSMELDKEKIIVFIGPSGCGKSTLLKMINRLYDPNEGEIYIEGKNISEVPVVELRRSMGYVVQQTGLFPHMTVLQNISVVPQMLDWDKEKILSRTKELLELVNLEWEVYLDRYPNQLSGGQQQRVGIARGMAADPEILLMDEPFSAIDIITRVKLQHELLTLQKKMGKTIFIVTHDVDEALKLADVVVIVNEGGVEQYGSPLEIISNPKNKFVEEFIGCKDIIRKLSVIRIESIMSYYEINKEGNDEINHNVNIKTTDTLKSALALMLEKGVEKLEVINVSGDAVGEIDWEQIRNFTKCNSKNIAEES